MNVQTVMYSDVETLTGREVSPHEYAVNLIKAYRDDLENGRINKMQLTRILMERYPGRWKSAASARNVIQGATGAKGSIYRRNAEKRGTVVKSDIFKGLRALHSHAQPLARVELNPGKWLILADIHLPYHDPIALEAAVKYGLDNGCENLLLNGDIMDCHYLSRYDKTPGSPDMSAEVGYMRSFLDTVRNLFGGDIVWKLGNHEDRFDRYVISKAVELFGLPGINLESLVEPGNHGCDTVVGAYSPMNIGSLCVIHGHEFGGGVTNPVNPARGLFLRAKASTIAGHNHQSSEHHESSIKGDAMACWSTGCLCELSPSYRPFAFTKWNHGFAVVDSAKDGTFTVQNRRIIDGVVH